MGFGEIAAVEVLLLLVPNERNGALNVFGENVVAIPVPEKSGSNFSS